MALRELYGTIHLKDQASSAIGKLKEAMDEAKKSAFSVQNTLEFLGGAEISKRIIEFGKDISGLAANEQETSLQVKNLAGTAYPELAESMREAAEASKGLMDEGDIQKSVSNALKFGASVDFIKGNLSSLQKMSAISGDDLTETMQKASMAAEYGNVRVLRSIPILNRHIEQIKALGTGTDEYSRKAREAMITKIFSEEQVDIGNKYNEVLKLTNSQTKVISIGIEEIKKTWGNLLNVAMKPFMSIIGKFLKYLTETERGMALIKIVGIALSFVFGTILVVALYSAASAAWAFITPLLPFIAIGLAVIAVLTGIVVVIQDIWTFFHGGESVTGKLVEKFKALLESNKALRIGLKILIAPFVALLTPMMSVIYAMTHWSKIWDKMKSGLSEAGKFGANAFNTMIQPALYFIKIIKEIPDAISWIMNKFGEIVDWVKDLPNRIKAAFLEAKESIKSFLSFGGKTSGSSEPIQKRASGGRIEAGKPYLVGENGPELRTFDSGGSIVSNSNLGGGQTIHIASLVGNMTFHVSGSAEAAGAVKDAVLKALDELSRTTFRAQLGMRVV